MEKTCAAVVVTFNRKELLLKNINKLINQTKNLDSIIIIDNASTDGTFEYLNENNLLENGLINYIKLSENIGGAGGFYEGVKLAAKLEYNWLWLMDDDGEPYDTFTFSKVFSKGEELRKQGITKILLNSLVLCDDQNLSFGLNKVKTKEKAIEVAENGLIKNHINPFNGTLVSLELINNIGFPNKDFFIKGDEHEFILRSIEKEAFIATVVDSLYKHPTIPTAEYILFGKKISLTLEKPWKEYYRARNYVYMYLNHKEYKSLAIFIAYRFISILINKDEKGKFAKMIVKGIIDGSMGKLGKRVMP